MPRRRAFPYAERAERFRRAQQALHRVMQHPPYEGRQAAVTAWWAGAEDAYPPGFWEALEQAKAGDAAGADLLIEFLEADPYCFRSGYFKADAAQYLIRVPLTETQRRRLRTVVLNQVAWRDSREFRRFCHLARALDCPALREHLQALAGAPDPGVRRRAGWMLDGLG